MISANLAPQKTLVGEPYTSLSYPVLQIRYMAVPWPKAQIIYQCSRSPSCVTGLVVHCHTANPTAATTFVITGVLSDSIQRRFSLVRISPQYSPKLIIGIQTINKNRTFADDGQIWQVECDDCATRDSIARHRFLLQTLYLMRYEQYWRFLHYRLHI